MDKPIRINVAGRIFTTSLRTLRRCPESTLFLSIADTTGMAECTDDDSEGVETDVDYMQTQTRTHRDQNGLRVSGRRGLGIGIGDDKSHNNMKSNPSSDDAVYFIDRDADAFADILKYMRHPDAYTPPEDPAFRYLVWCESQFYGVSSLSARLGEFEKTPQILPYDNPLFEVSPGLLSGLSRIPGCVHARITRERATDLSYPVSFTDYGMGFPEYDSITDSRGLVISLPHHHLRLSGIAMCVDVDEVIHAASRLGDRYEAFRRFNDPETPEIVVYGITPTRRRHRLLMCREGEQEPIRRCALTPDIAPELIVGLYVSLEQESRDIPVLTDIPFASAVLMIKKIELYGSAIPIPPWHAAEDAGVHMDQAGDIPEIQRLGVGNWTISRG